MRDTICTTYTRAPSRHLLNYPRLRRLRCLLLLVGPDPKVNKKRRNGLWVNEELLNA